MYGSLSWDRPISLLFYVALQLMIYICFFLFVALGVLRERLYACIGARHDVEPQKKMDGSPGQAMEAPGKSEVITVKGAPSAAGC